MYPLSVCFIMLLLQRSGRVDFLKQLAVAEEKEPSGAIGLNAWSGLYRYALKSKFATSKKPDSLAGMSREYSLTSLRR